MLYSIPLYSSKVQRFNLKTKTHHLDVVFVLSLNVGCLDILSVKWPKIQKSEICRAAGGSWRHRRMDACWWFGTKTSVPVNKKLSFQTQHEPSLICVFTVSHTWIQRCSAWESLTAGSPEPKHLTSTDNPGHQSHTIITTRCWTCGMEISSAHTGTNGMRLPPIKHFHLFYQALFYLLLKLFLAIVLCSPLFFAAQSDLEIWEGFSARCIFPNRAFTQYKLTRAGLNLSHVLCIFVPRFTVPINGAQRVLVTLGVLL